jgi:hypothetical protein
MATNPYFQEYEPERTLLTDLTIETIKTMGRDMIYLPREYFTRDPIFGEDPTSKFRDGYTIEMYIQNVQKFDGAGYFVNKFGINIQDKITLQVSKKRFEDEIATKTSNITVPREGDLIYFPFNKSIFEINYVEDKIPFFQFGILTTYTLVCELFTYSYEEIDTNIPDIDDIASSRSYNLLKLSISESPIVGLTMINKGETVYQVNGVTGSSAAYVDRTASAIVSDIFSGGLLLREMSGTFLSSNNASQSIKGASTGAEFYVLGVTESNIIQPIDPVSGIEEVENDYYAKQSAEINFSKDNPFSEECT